MEILVLNIWPCQEDPASMIHPGARESPPGFLPPCWSTYQNQTPCLHPAGAWPGWGREHEEQRTPEVFQGRGSATWSDRYFPGDPGLWLVSHEDTQLWLVSTCLLVTAEVMTMSPSINLATQNIIVQTSVGFQFFNTDYIFQDQETLIIKVWLYFLNIFHVNFSYFVGLTRHSTRIKFCFVVFRYQRLKCRVFSFPLLWRFYL